MNKELLEVYHHFMTKGESSNQRTLSSAYKIGLDGKPLPCYVSKYSLSYAAWLAGVDTRKQKQ